MDTDVQHEEALLVDLEALAVLRGGLGESYRRSLLAILADAPQALSFKKVVEALRVRQDHTCPLRQHSRLAHYWRICTTGGPLVRGARCRNRRAPATGSARPDARTDSTSGHESEQTQFAQKPASARTRHPGADARDHKHAKKH